MIRKFENPEDILNSFFDVRLSYYEKRKAHLLSRLTEEWEKLDNKVRFITAVVDSKLKVSNRKKSDLLADLNKQGFKTFGADKQKGSKKAANDDEEDDEAEEDGPGASSSSGGTLEKGYDYLLSMKIWSLTMERVKALQAQAEEKRAELDLLSGKSPEDLYIEDLDALEEALGEMEEDFAEAEREEARARTKATNARGKKAARGKGGSAKANGRGRAAAAGGGDDDDYDSFDDFMEEQSDEEYGAKKKKKAPAKKAAGSKAAKDASVAASDEPFVPPAVPAGMVIKEPKAPRAPKAPKAATSASALSTKSAPVAKSTAAMSKLKEQERRAASKGDDSDEEQTMSLFERLKLNNSQSSALSTLGSMTGAAGGLSASAAALAKKKAAPIKRAATKPKGKRKTAMDLLSDDEDEDSEMDMSDDFCDSEDVTPEKPKKRAPAKKPAGGVKRAVKSSKAATEEVFSPGVPTPKATKRPK
jgi:DNA topoisomerase-2